MSIPCPQCGERTRVIDSRLTGDNRIRRRRTCDDCDDYRFTTIEVIVAKGRAVDCWVFNTHQLQDALAMVSGEES